MFAEGHKYDCPNYNPRLWKCNAKGSRGESIIKFEICPLIDTNFLKKINNDKKNYPEEFKELEKSVNEGVEKLFKNRYLTNNDTYRGAGEKCPNCKKTMNIITNRKHGLFYRCMNCNYQEKPEEMKNRRRYKIYNKEEK